MSYLTNPLIIRAGITQGWYQNYFPFYKFQFANSTLFWYKIYILTRFYFRRLKMELINFEIKTDNTSIIMLYFNIQRHYKRKISVKLFSRKQQQFFRYTKRATKSSGYLARFNLFRYLKLKRKKNKRKYAVWKKHIFSLTKKDLRNLSLRFLNKFVTFWYEKGRILFALRKNRLVLRKLWNKKTVYRVNQLDSKYFNLNTNKTLLNSLNKKRFFIKHFNNVSVFDIENNIKFQFNKKRIQLRNTVRKNFNFSQIHFKYWYKPFSLFLKDSLAKKLIRNNYKFIKKNKIKILKKKTKLLKNKYKTGFKRKHKIKYITKSVNINNNIFDIPRKLLKKIKKKRITSTNVIPKYLKIYRFEQILTQFLKKKFNLIFIIKIIQNLHKIIKTKRLLRKINQNRVTLLYRYKNIRFYKKVLRSFFSFYRYNQIFKITDQLKTLLEYNKKKHTYPIRTIRELVATLKPAKILSYKIVICGKINAKTRARTYTINYNGISRNYFNTKLDYVRAKANARTGSFMLHFYTFSKFNRKYVEEEKQFKND